VTHLRKIMLEELRRRNYSESTIHAYIRSVEHFSCYFHRPPNQLSPEHIRQYQAALFTRWKLAPNTVTQRLAALRFFFIKVLKLGWSVESFIGKAPAPQNHRIAVYRKPPGNGDIGFTCCGGRDDTAS
jgi:site-specific recombinase XerD